MFSDLNWFPLHPALVFQCIASQTQLVGKCKQIWSTVIDALSAGGGVLQSFHIELRWFFVQLFRLGAIAAQMQLFEPNQREGGTRHHGVVVLHLLLVIVAVVVILLLLRIRGREGGTGHDGLVVAQNQPNWKDLNRAQRRAHYWIMRAVQGHSAHFTAHLGIILAWKENLEVTAHSSIKISGKCPGTKFCWTCLKRTKSCPSLFHLNHLQIFSVLSYSVITSCWPGDPSKRWRFPLKQRDVVTAMPITAFSVR